MNAIRKFADENMISDFKRWDHRARWNLERFNNRSTEKKSDNDEERERFEKGDDLGNLRLLALKRSLLSSCSGNVLRSSKHGENYITIALEREGFRRSLPSHTRENRRDIQPLNT